MTLYVDNNAVTAAPCVVVYGGQRLAMRGTAIGREASRKSTYVASRAGPDREHVRRVPLAGIAVRVRAAVTAGEINPFKKGSDPFLGEVGDGCADAG